MAGEIASAYVRLRPNMTGFKAETERGVRSSFKDLAKIAGVAFGAHEAFNFGKEIVGHAADVQRQVRAIGSEFGSASKQITDFSEKGAAGLGISAHLADKTAARFGILFKNLNIGGDQAAQMTIGFEKLAGSLSQIRNIDPAAALQNLPLAVAGNLRSLKQLGIATDQTQLKVAAFKLGLTQSISQGLTPQQRAIAIYAIATSKLGEYQRQAAAHSDDLAVKQRKLRAEWDNAKDELGAGLLPPMSRLIGYLSDKLPGGLEKTKAGFKDLANVVSSVSGPIGGTADAVKALIAAFLIAKLVSFGQALIAIPVKAFAIEMEATSAETVAAFGTMGAAARGFSIVLKSALASAGIGLLLIGLGLAAEYVITHWEKVKGWFSTFVVYLKRILATAWTAIKEGGKAAAYGILEYFTYGIQEILKVASHLPFIGKYARRALNAIQDEIDKFKPDFTKVGDKWRETGINHGDIYAAAFKAEAAAQIATFGGTLPALSALLGKQVNDKVTDTIIHPPKIAKPGISRDLNAANDALDAINTSISNTVKKNDAGISKIKTQLGDLGTSLEQATSQVAKDLSAAVDQAKQNLGSLSQSISDSIDQVIDKPLQDAQNKISRLANLKAVADLRRSALLPGGKTLSADPKKAIAQLEELRAHASALSRGSIDAFLAQYKAAYLTVKGDQAQVVKDRTKQSLADLTDSFNRGQLSITEYKKRVLALLTRDHVSYNKAGKLLGSAFANGFRDQVQGLFTQAGLISTAGSRGSKDMGVTNIVRPLEAIQADQEAVQSIQRQIRDKHGALQTRIAKAAEKSAKLHEKQVAAQEKLNSVILGPSSNIFMKNPGHGKQRNDVLNGTTR